MLHIRFLYKSTLAVHIMMTSVTAASNRRNRVDYHMLPSTVTTSGAESVSPNYRHLHATPERTQSRIPTSMCQLMLQYHIN